MRALGLDILRDLVQVHGIAPEPVKLPHNDHFAGADIFHHGVKHRAISRGPLYLFLEYVERVDASP